jgi:hypothetical protein
LDANQHLEQEHERSRERVADQLMKKLLLLCHEVEVVPCEHDTLQETLFSG